MALFAPFTLSAVSVSTCPCLSQPVVLVVVGGGFRVATSCEILLPARVISQVTVTQTVFQWDGFPRLRATIWEWPTIFNMKMKGMGSMKRRGSGRVLATVSDCITATTALCDIFVLARSQRTCTDTHTVREAETPDLWDQSFWGLTGNCEDLSFHVCWFFFCRHSKELLDLFLFPFF